MKMGRRPTLHCPNRYSLITNYLVFGNLLTTCAAPVLQLLLLFLLFLLVQLSFLFLLLLQL